MNDGGPAFPLSFGSQNEDGSWSPDSTPGMSMLDYFAGQALQGVLASECRLPDTQASVANLAYGLAAAMLSERELRMKEK